MSSGRVDGRRSVTLSRGFFGRRKGSLSRRALVLSFAAAVVFAGCGGKDRHSQNDEITVVRYTITTRDHVALALFRYIPSQAHPTPKPILLCPGILENHYAFDLAPGSSLARYLACRGIEVWTIEYRGRGSSGVPEGTTEERAPWSVDDFGYLDIPAAVDLVKEESGSEELFLLGYSEGAAATTAYLLEADSASSVCGQIWLAPSLVMGATSEQPHEAVPPLQNLCNFLFLLEPLFPPDLLLDVPGFVQPIYRFFMDSGLEPELLESDIWEVLWNKNNMTAALAREAIFKLVSTISGNEVKQYLRGANYFHRRGISTFEGSRLEREKGPFFYMERIPQVTVPTLVLAGTLDHLVPPVTAEYLLGLLGSQDKSIRVFGLAQGDHVDFGHVDLSVGVHAEEDVYPVAAEWLLGRM